MRTKTFREVRVKDAAQGIVEAVFATLGVKDKDGDVAYKSSFDDGAPVVLSAYQHGSWGGALPYGYGTIKVSDTEAVAECQFLMDTAHGRDAFLTIKALGEQGLQEWSYSLHDVKSSRGELNGEKVNVLDHIRVKEVSPVMEGAGIDTRVLSTKSTSGDDEATDEVGPAASYAPKGASFSEHTTAVLAAVEALTVRASEVVALRVEKGKSISDTSAGQLKQLDDALMALRQVIDPPVIKSTSDELVSIWLHAVARDQGVTT